MAGGVNRTRKVAGTPDSVNLDNHWSTMVLGTFTMMKPTLLLYLLLAVLGNRSNNAPISLAVVPTRSFGDVGSITMSLNQPQEFFVVLTNVSAEPQAIWELWNSWGYQTVSFEMTTSDGKKFEVSKYPEEFTKNNPSTFTVQPGEHQVYAIHLDKTWVTSPAFPKADEIPITLKAIYEVVPTKEATTQKVWVGRVESRSYKLLLRQW